MSKLPAVRPTDLARVARRLRFLLDRQKEVMRSTFAHPMVGEW
jgi:hypothetical protein